MPPLTHLTDTVREATTVTGLPIEGWSVVWISFATILPWTIVAFYDAIDIHARSLYVVVFRLALSSACNLVAYTVGSLFVYEIVEQTSRKCKRAPADCEYDRFDEVATFLVLLFFNLWFVLRNIRGWIQLLSLRRLRPLFLKMQTGFAQAAVRPDHAGATHVIAPPDDRRRPYVTIEDVPNGQLPVQVDGLALLTISDRLINNDVDTATPLLNPFFLGSHKWQLAAWRAWWTQRCGQHQSLAAPIDYDTSAVAVRAQDLPEEGPRWPMLETEDVHHPADNSVIPRDDAQAWLRALVCYGGPDGQQDTRGPPDDNLFSVNDRSGIATLVHEKTRFRPHRMSSLWYNTARFDDLYTGLAVEINKRNGDSLMMPSTFVMWKEIATDIAQHLDEPMYLSGEELCVYAGELASASILLSYFPAEFRKLVERVYQDGRSARWTFGWSGLLSCFSNLWTRQRVFVAMLNGLSLLALKSANSVGEIEPCVRAMMVGYASFAVSDRAVGKRIAQARKAELLVRYRRNRGKTCRGSGLCSTRLACRILGIPAEASHMDGLPAFSTGWAMEYMDAKPGSQKPEHGGSHNEVEEREGSSNAWRYPDSHI